MDAESREMLTRLSPRVLGLAEALEPSLSPPTFELVLLLVARVDDAASDRNWTEEERLWQRFRAHFPGLTPALDVVRAHVLGEQAACCREESHHE